MSVKFGDGGKRNKCFVRGPESFGLFITLNIAFPFIPNTFVLANSCIDSNVAMVAFSGFLSTRIIAVLYISTVGSRAVSIVCNASTSESNVTGSAPAPATTLGATEGSGWSGSSFNINKDSSILYG